MPNTNPIIKLNPARVLFILLAISALLVAASIWGQYLKYFPQNIDISGPWEEFLLDLMIHAFFLDAEANVPTFFNTFLLFSSALLLAVIAAWKNSLKDKFRYAWMGLALFFLFLAVDETAVLHEKLIKPMRAWLDLGGVFYFSWVIPGLAFVALLGLIYLRFFIHLDGKFKLLFFISIAMYFAGVLGGEMISGRFAETIGQKNFTYAVAASLEESIELAGASMVVYSLLAYLKQYLPEGITLKA